LSGKNWKCETENNAKNLIRKRTSLTRENVATMRASYTGRYGQMTELAKQHGLSVPATHAILHGRTWKPEQ
jgi:hypothetical protein